MNSRLIFTLTALVLGIISCNPSQELVPKEKQLVPQRAFSLKIV